MWLNRIARRSLLKGISALGLLLLLTPRPEAQFAQVGVKPSLPARSVINHHFTRDVEYQVIEMFKFAVNIPASSDFAGPYVVTWEGEGTCRFTWGQGSMFTINDALSTPYTRPVSDRFQGSEANNRIVFSWDPGVNRVDAASIQLFGGDPDGELTWKMMRLEDEADYLAGKIFRREYLQAYLDLYPGCVRFMNWIGGNDSMLMRWSNRSLLTDFFWDDFVTSGGIPVYGTTANVGNAYTLDAIPSTPASMQQGEVCQCTVGTGVTGAHGGANNITNITATNPAVVSYSGDPPANGDKLVFRASSGMVEMDYRVGTVANLNTGAGTFELSDIDASGFTAWDKGAVYALWCQYATLQVGSGNDRTPYPIMFLNAQFAITSGAGFWGTGHIKAAVFDKTIRGARLANGTWIEGAWLAPVQQYSNPYRAGVPFEICVAWIVEINELAAAQGKRPIHMWINNPHMGLLSMDPDYDAAESPVLKMLEMALDELPQNVTIVIENSNETWNGGGAGFQQVPFYGRKGQIRWSGGFGGSYADYQSFSTLRSCVMASDIKAAFPSTSDRKRIAIIMGGQGTSGPNGPTNETRIYGNATLDGDALFRSIIKRGDPIDIHDGFSFASYFEPAITQEMLDAWMVLWNGGKQSEAIAGFIEATEDPLIGGGETVGRYRDELLPTYVAAMRAKNKMLIGYEGGSNWGTAFCEVDCPGTPVPPEINAFLLACKNSQGWADLHRTWFDEWAQHAPTAVAAADYVTIAGLQGRWGHAPSTPYLDGVYGGAYNLDYHGIAAYNATYSL